MSNVFISYSHSDAQIAHSIAKGLEQFGIKIWIDYAELRVGDSLISCLRNALDRATHLIALISENSIESSWVQKELEIATIKEIEGKKIQVLPAVIDQVELPGFLLGKYYAQFNSKGDNTLAIAKLVRSIDEHFEPINPPLYPGENIVNNPYLAVNNKHFHIATLYNGLALEIVKYAAKFSPAMYNFLMPEHIRRLDDDLTYYHGSGGTGFYEDAKERYEKALEEYAPYQYLLSAQGILMRQAVRLFLESARSGDPEAMWNIGWRYELGQGVPEDRTRAIYFWRLAAKSGHDPSIKKLDELGVSGDTEWPE